MEKIIQSMDQPNFYIVDSSLSNKNMSKLNLTVQYNSHDILTLVKLMNTLKMALDKYLGAKRLTTDFYKTKWNELRQPLVENLFFFESMQSADGQ